MFLRTLALLLFLFPVYLSWGASNSIPLANAQKVGQTRFTYYFWDVYDATLFAPDGDYDTDKPFALRLSYLRDFKGRDIAERSIGEMEKQGVGDKATLAQWQAELNALFPDVTEGDTLTGVMNEQGEAIFYLNGEKIGELKNHAFSRAFFDIWLGANTSEPEMRNKLLGDK